MAPGRQDDRRGRMGEKGMDAGPAVGADPQGTVSHTPGDAAGMATPADPSAGSDQPLDRSGPHPSEIIEDILDPLGIHKLL
jgi:hypothetical protein